jgi:N-acetylgalactosamine kinase
VDWVLLLLLLLVMCRYECSCDELNALCAAARRCGAIGARLSGAGWGGVVVALVDSDVTSLDTFIAQLKVGFERG